MDRQQILDEIERRNNISQIDTQSISRESILKEIQNRSKKPDKSTMVDTKGEYIPTAQEEAKQNPFGVITDDVEIPQMNQRSQAVEDYLQSPAFGRLVLEVTGGVAGSILAPGIAPAVLIGRMASYARPALQMTFTRMAGAGLGEAAGAGVSQTFDPTYDSKDDFEKIAGDVMKDLGRAYATGVVGEGVGVVANKAIAKVIGKNKKLIEGAEEAVETIEKQKEKILSSADNIYENKVRDAAATGQLTPGLLQEGQFIDLIENISELSLVGGGSIRYAREGAETIAQSGIDDFVKNFKVSTDDYSLGTLFQKTLTDDLNAFRAVSKTKYKALDNALKSTNPEAVSLLNLKKTAQEELNNIGLQTENADIRNFLTGIIKNKNNISFQQANNIRSDLLEISRQFSTEGLSQKKARLSAIFSKKITQAMDEAVIPDATKELYKDANKFYKDGAEIFNTKLFSKIIENDPELVYKSIVAAGDRPTLIQKTFDIIDKRIKDPVQKDKLINSIRGQFLEDAVAKSQKTNSQYGQELDANKLNNFLSKKKQTVKEMFTVEQIKELNKFKNALAFSQGRLKKKGGLPGAIMIQMKQSGAVMQLIGAGGAGIAGAPVFATSIILAPAVMAKAFTNPKIVKALTLGYRYNQNQTLAGRYFRQAIAQMSKEGLISKDQEDEIYNDMKENGYKK